jgi:hypothetical protein
MLAISCFVSVVCGRIRGIMHESKLLCSGAKFFAIDAALYEC